MAEDMTYDDGVVEVEASIEKSEEREASLARQALEEVRALREEQDEAWKTNVITKLDQLIELMSSQPQTNAAGAADAASETDEADEADVTLNIETPPAPSVSRRRQRRRRRLKF